VPLLTHTHAELMIGAVQSDDSLTTGAMPPVGWDERLFSGHTKPHCLHAFGILPFCALRIGSCREFRSEPPLGLEPRTPALRKLCSTD
jgi:hypothetical protein